MSDRLKATDERRIYVACLACYNAGHLVGEWIDATDAESFDLSTLEHAPDVCPHEEAAIHDYEGFGEIKLSENESMADVAKIAELLDEHGDAFAAWYANESRDNSEDLGEQFREVYRGEFRDLADYAADYVEQTDMLHGVPETVARYFDYESFGRDMELGGDVWTADSPGGVYVFESR